ncbi:MAG: VWA domain-containing protein [Pyrinomonadaceae bacterium]|nr:VWA domain-containing protein [Pyrinomonadaceae bacterium]
MKAATILIILFLGASAFAQSGRRIRKPKTTPSPKAVVDENVYSESRPKPRRIYPKNYQIPGKKKDAPKVEKKVELDENGEEIISVDATLVTIPISIRDRNGLYIPNVRKEEVKIFEEGREQEIAYFGTSSKPFTVALLIDTSPSTAYKIKDIRAAAKAFVAQLQAHDSVMVIEFDGDPQVLTEATTNRQEVYRAIDKADFGNGTALYDAVHVALNKRLDKIEGRKAIVLFTDGVDTVSGKSYISTVTDAEESDTVIFPIYYNTFLDSGNGGGALGNINGGIIPTIRSRGRGTSAQEYAEGKAYLEDLAISTGGRVYRPESTPGGLIRAFQAIAEELRRQYNLGYYPDKEGEFGERRSIKVRVYRPKLIIQARDSYIVGSDVTSK